MKRFVVFAVVSFALVLFADRPASAMGEFCPATLDYEAVGQSSKAVPAQMYGLELTALGPRKLTSVILAFDTSAGWYSDVVDFQRTDYASPIFYARFPQTLNVTRAWVTQAAAQNDPGFGWEAQGTVACDPLPESSLDQIRERTKRAKDIFPDLDPVIDPKDEDKLSSPPSADSLLLVADESKPLESADCAVPFQAATVESQAQARYPNVWVSRNARSIVQVAIQPDGTLYDAWIWAPSGVSQFDAESVRAARATTYVGARAYCRPVPGRYFFKVTFNPNG